MVLDDVAQRAGLVVEVAAALDADRLGHRDLDGVDVAPVPDRLEEAVAEAEDGEVLDRLLAEVVIDPIDLVLVEDGGDLAVEGLGAGQIGSERLLDDDARPAALRPAAATVARHRQAGPIELVDDLGVQARRDGQVEEPIPRRPAVAVDPVEPPRQLHEGGRVVEVPAVVLDPARERLPDRRLGRLVTAVLVDPFEQVLAELRVGQISPREADHGELRRQEAAQQGVVERRTQLALGQVTGRPADDHRARLGHPLQPQALAQRVRRRCRRRRGGRRDRRHRRARSRAGRISYTLPLGPRRPRYRSLIAWPPNSLRRAARTRSVYESGSRRLRKRSIRARVMIGAGTS